MTKTRHPHYNNLLILNVYEAPKKMQVYRSRGKVISSSIYFESLIFSSSLPPRPSSTIFSKLEMRMSLISFSTLEI